MNGILKKKIIIGLLIVIFLGLFAMLKIIISNMAYKELPKYNLMPNEEIKTSFKYNKKEYVITTRFPFERSYGDNNLLLKVDDEYYILEQINNCDMNYYILNNEIYIHCSGKKGDILKYTINKYEVNKEVLQFNYNNTPNTSQLHLTVKDVDSEYIYLKSYLKLDNSIADGEYIKCSLVSRMCEYYKDK